MSWRTDIENRVKGLATMLEARWNSHLDLERRFQEHIRSHGAKRPSIKIEHNPINNMYQWEIYPAPTYDDCGRGPVTSQPFSEGRADSYQAAVDAVIYHEARLRLGLPNKPNGVTKNY